MTKTTNLFLFLAIATILIASPLTTDSVFADKDHDKKVKTFESECAKKLDKKKLNLDGLFCLVITDIQATLADLQSQIDTIELTPGPQGPAGINGSSIAQYAYGVSGGIPLGNFSPTLGQIVFANAIMPFDGTVIAASMHSSGLDVGEQITCSISGIDLIVYSPGQNSDYATGGTSFNAGDILSVNCTGSTNGEPNENMNVSVIVDFNIQ